MSDKYCRPHYNSFTRIISSSFWQWTSLQEFFTFSAYFLDLRKTFCPQLSSEYFDDFKETEDHEFWKVSLDLCWWCLWLQGTDRRFWARWDWFFEWMVTKEAYFAKISLVFPHCTKMDLLQLVLRLRNVLKVTNTTMANFPLEKSILKYLLFLRS